MIRYPRRIRRREHLLDFPRPNYRAKSFNLFYGILVFLFDDLAAALPSDAGTTTVAPGSCMSPSGRTGRRGVEHGSFENIFLALSEDETAGAA
jgi:hypothetical protein